MSAEPRTDVLVDHVKWSAAQATDWTRKRDHDIVTAVNNGVSQREVARIAGLSHTTVQNIVRKATAGAS